MALIKILLACGALTGLSLSGLASASLAQPLAVAGEPLAIRPMTRIGPDGMGYMADPQPIRLAPSARSGVQMVSGTTRAVLSCTYPLRPECFSWTPIRVTVGPLAADITAAGDTLTNIQNIDIFQDDGGGWHGAVTIGVKSDAHPKHWTLITHAHPIGPVPTSGPPLDWAVDTILTGSLTHSAEGNYDGKYFSDDGRLYLLFVDTIAPPPQLRNAIFLQPMASPTQAGPEPRIMLLRPGDRYGPIPSEIYGRTQARLVEAPYLSKIGGKYALVYSTGAYLTPGYKAGVAWSDTLRPPPGGLYRKVLQSGGGGPPEVRYLVQSADTSRADFTGDQVIGPGVAAAVQGPEGAWWLYFNGFAPDDMPPGPQGRVDGAHRRPFYLQLRAQVPADRRAATTTDEDLVTWLTPERR